jgi:single-stranded-DNA-specific exonuclease
LLAEYLQACGLATMIHIPDRVFEGYGPNAAAMRGFAEKGAKLVVAVDCGATSHEAFAEAKALGLDVIVFDHHQAPEALPAALALVDPNRQDDLSGLGYLSAAGVVYMALVALQRALRGKGFWDGKQAPDLLEALDLVAASTAPSSSKAYAQCAAAAGRVLRLCSTSRAPTGRRNRTISAFSSARASMRAGGSEMPRSASNC